MVKLLTHNIPKKIWTMLLVSFVILGNSGSSVGLTIIYPAETDLHVKVGDQRTYLITEFQFGNHTSEKILISTGIITMEKGLNFTHVVTAIKYNFQNISYQVGNSVFHVNSTNVTCINTSGIAYSDNSNNILHQRLLITMVERTFADKNKQYDNLNYPSQELLIKTGDYFIRETNTANYTHLRVYNDQTGWLVYYYHREYFNTTITYGDGTTYEKGFTFILEVKQLAYKDTFSKEKVESIINSYSIINSHKIDKGINYDFPTSLILFIVVAVVYRKKKKTT